MASGFRIALGLFRFPAPLVSLRCSHAAFYFLDLALIFQYSTWAERRVFHQPVLYHRPSQLKIPLALEHSRAHVAHTVRFRERAPPRLRLAPALAFIAASEIVVLCLPVDEFRQWLFYTLRQAFLLWCLAFGVYRYCTARNEVEKGRLRRQEPLFLITLVLCLCVLIEDIVMILVFDSSFFANADMLPGPYQRAELLREHPASDPVLFHPARRCRHPCACASRSRRVPMRPTPRNTWTSCFPPSASAIT